jgi:hypothetical protein
MEQREGKLIQSAVFSPLIPLVLLFLACIVAACVIALLCLLYPVIFLLVLLYYAAKACVDCCQSLVRGCMARRNTKPDSVDLEAQVFCLPFSMRWCGLPGPPPEHPHAAIDLKEFNTKPGIPSPPPPYYSVRQTCARWCCFILISLRIASRSATACTHDSSITLIIALRSSGQLFTSAW